MAAEWSAGQVECGWESTRSLACCIWKGTVRGQWPAWRVEQELTSPLIPPLIPRNQMFNSGVGGFFKRKNIVEGGLVYSGFLHTHLIRKLTICNSSYSRRDWSYLD